LKKTNTGNTKQTHILDVSTSGKPSNGRPLVFGMVHVPALPGSPNYCGDIDRVTESCSRDARILADGGVDAIMIENFGDAPFFKDSVPALTIAHMTALAIAVKAAGNLPIGINVLRNDGMAAMSIAHASGADFIRVNVLAGARLCDQGIIEGKAAEILRLRASIQGTNIKILADVDVKHSAALAPRPLIEEAEELLCRAGADGLIVSGSGTGKETPLDKVAELRRAFPGAFIAIGSGATSGNVSKYIAHASAIIVGSSIKQGGAVAPGVPVDLALTQAFVAATHGK